MFVRSAFFHGQLSAEQHTEFKHHMTTVVAPLVRTFPGCQRLEQFWSVEGDDTAPDTILIMMHCYTDKEAMLAALESEQRTASMQATMEILGRLPVEVYHINQQLIDYPDPTS